MLGRGATRARNRRRLSTAPVGHDHIGCAHDPCVPGSKGQDSLPLWRLPYSSHWGDADPTRRHSRYCRRSVGHRNGRARTKASSQARRSEHCRSIGMTTRWRPVVSRDANQADGGHTFRYGLEFLRQTITKEAAGATVGKTAFIARITKSSSSVSVVCAAWYAGSREPATQAPLAVNPRPL